MRDAWYWFMFGLMLTSAAANLYACVRSAMAFKQARKSWKRANELADALAELHDEYVKVQATEAFINTMNKGEEQ